MVTVGETRRKLPQVALLDRLAAQCTERRRVGCPAIHQHEFHVPTHMRKRADPANQLIANLSVTRDRLSPNKLQSLRESRARSSPAHFGRDELGHKVLELAWQWLVDGRQVSDGRLTTDSGKCVIR